MWRIFKIKATADCETRNVIYVIECLKYKTQYVGKTENTLHVWMNGHHSDIKHQRLEKPGANHFGVPGHFLDDLVIFVIEKIYRDKFHFSESEGKLLDPDTWSTGPKWS